MTFCEDRGEVYAGSFVEKGSLLGFISGTFSRQSKKTVLFMGEICPGHKLEIEVEESNPFRFLKENTNPNCRIECWEDDVSDSYRVLVRSVVPITAKSVLTFSSHEVFQRSDNQR